MTRITITTLLLLSSVATADQHRIRDNYWRDAIRQRVGRARPRFGSPAQLQSFLEKRDPGLGRFQSRPIRIAGHKLGFSSECELPAIDNMSWLVSNFRPSGGRLSQADGMNLAANLRGYLVPDAKRKIPSGWERMTEAQRAGYIADHITWGDLAEWGRKKIAAPRFNARTPNTGFELDPAANAPSWMDRTLHGESMVVVEVITNGSFDTVAKVNRSIDDVRGVLKGTLGFHAHGPTFKRGSRHRGPWGLHLTRMLEILNVGIFTLGLGKGGSNYINHKNIAMPSHEQLDALARHATSGDQLPTPKYWLAALRGGIYSRETAEGRTTDLDIYGVETRGLAAQPGLLQKTTLALALTTKHLEQINWAATGKPLDLRPERIEAAVLAEVKRGVEVKDRQGGTHRIRPDEIYPILKRRRPDEPALLEMAVVHDRLLPANQKDHLPLSSLAVPFANWKDQRWMSAEARTTAMSAQRDLARHIAVLAFRMERTKDRYDADLKSRENEVFDTLSQGLGAWGSKVEVSGEAFRFFGIKR